MNDSILELSDVMHRFGPLEVLRPISFAVADREILAIVGPSGCGKTTLLNIISGAIAPSAGRVHRSGNVRTVFQQSGLLPWRTVAQNIQLGLRNGQQLPDADAARELDDLLRLVRLEKFMHYYPHQLSGGMRQRVEVARALAGDTDILLLDEPFSSLDYLTRLRMRDELVGILDARPRTVILVTHDVTEAAQLADRVLVLSDRPGRIRKTVRVDVPRPREVTSPAVVSVVHEILTELGLEHGAPFDVPSPMI